MSQSANPSPLMVALEQFEAGEANLAKLERLWAELEQLLPGGINFGSNPQYEDRARSFGAIQAALPKIDGWRPTSMPPDLDALAQNRLDALDLGEPSSQAEVERHTEAPGRELRDYRFRFNAKRRALVRDSLMEMMDAVDADLALLRQQSGSPDDAVKLDDAAWRPLREHVKQIEVLLGGSAPRPARWSDLRRHAGFADPHDLSDIEASDWPTVKTSLRKDLYAQNEPLPVEVADLADLVAAKPRGPVITALAWDKLTDDDFERLMFSLISGTPGYENPEWLMKTRAPDRGRDLSATRIVPDELAATLRLRVIIQCKHWLSKSVTLQEVSGTEAQMALWGHPPVDVLVVATSGRFVTDAVQWVEQHNAKGVRPRIELWPESHLERLLAGRPAMIAEFGLR